MSTTICLLANTLYYPEGGGHLWVHLNWALGLRALGCRIIWLEMVEPSTSGPEVRVYVAALKNRLGRYGLAENVALCSSTSEPLPQDVEDRYLDLDAAAEADLLLNLRYDVSIRVVERFRRTALIDIDPGLLQVCMSKGWMSVARHDVYFSTGETVGQPNALFPDAGLKWEYTPPCVALDWWLPHEAARDAPFTTVSHWYMDEWVVEDDGQFYRNDKRAGFLPFLDLPARTAEPLELALCLGGDDNEQAALQERGWRVREADTVASTPWDYQRYIQNSRGEFSCVKPSCIQLQNAWISDRTLCYLASGKPAIVQHTGASRFLPDAAGLFRFRNIKEAARYLEEVATDYERQSRLARALAEEHFDARRIAGQVLERALT